MRRLRQLVVHALGGVAKPTWQSTPPMKGFAWMKAADGIYLVDCLGRDVGIIRCLEGNADVSGWDRKIEGTEQWIPIPDPPTT